MLLVITHGKRGIPVLVWKERGSAGPGAVLRNLHGTKFMYRGAVDTTKKHVLASVALEQFELALNLALGKCKMKIYASFSVLIPRAEGARKFFDLLPGGVLPP